MDFENLKDKTILIVDDQPRNLDVLVSSLEKFGFDFVVAQNGKEAIQRVEQLMPDMILLDILMPGMDGFQVCETLKKDEVFKTIPVIFMSALTETVDKLKGFELGAVDYITKPFQLEEIIARIRTHLLISTLQNELHNTNANLEEKVEQRTQELAQANVNLQTEVKERKSLERRYRLLLETLQEGVWAVDKEYKTIYANPRMAEIMGYTVDEFTEKSARDFFPHIIQRLTAEQEYDTKQYFDITLRHKNGSELFLTIASTPLVNHKNEHLGVLLAVSDISKRKQAELKLIRKDKELEEQNKTLVRTNLQVSQINQELQVAKDKAEESDRLKSAFLANLSHEIRTPMNAIIGFAELLKSDDMPSSAKEIYLDHIVAGTQQLLSIITDIIEISKLEANQLLLDETNFNVASVMDELYDVVQNDLRLSKKTHVRLIKPKNTSFMLNTDEQRFRQVLGKLLKNAVKFTSEGEIEFGCERKGEALVFFVRDTGIGIPKEAKEIIFERFRQVEEHYTRQFGGTGLGLAISRGFIELMGGQIWLESEIDKGSTFYFSVPIHAKSSGKIISKEQKEPDVEDSIFDAKTILIVEDEEINVLYLKELLAGTNASVLVAKNGKEAIEVFEKHPETSLILMDIKMPVLNGFEALKVIKSSGTNVPIIAQTAYAMSEDEERTMEAGFDAYLSKPIKRDRLFNLIQHFL